MNPLKYTEDKIPRCPKKGSGKMVAQGRVSGALRVSSCICLGAYTLNPQPIGCEVLGSMGSCRCWGFSGGGVLRRLMEACEV